MPKLLGICSNIFDLSGLPTSLSSHHRCTKRDLNRSSFHFWPIVGRINIQAVVPCRGLVDCTLASVCLASHLGRTTQSTIRISQGRNFLKSKKKKKILNCLHFGNQFDFVLYKIAQIKIGCNWTYPIPWTLRGTYPVYHIKSPLFVLYVHSMSYAFVPIPFSLRYERHRAPEVCPDRISEDRRIAWVALPVRLLAGVAKRRFPFAWRYILYSSCQ